MKRAISSGLLSIDDVLQHEWQGRNLLHCACDSFGFGSSGKIVSATLALGFDINAVDSQGDTCLGVFSGNIGPRTSQVGSTYISGALRQQKTLVFLLQSGADDRIVPLGLPPVSHQAYSCHCFGFCWSDERQPHGSYCGDLWDSALSLRGKQISVNRLGHQRRAKYTEWYTRDIFEALWRGRESECPYWDDKPWPPSAKGVCPHCIDYHDEHDHIQDESDEKEYDAYESDKSNELQY